MMFWDSSAIIPLCIDEPQTKTIRQIVRKDSAVAVWWGSFIECCSAFASCGARDSSNLKRKTECGISSPFSRIHGRRLNPAKTYGILQEDFLCCTLSVPQMPCNYLPHSYGQENGQKAIISSALIQN